MKRTAYFAILLAVLSTVSMTQSVHAQTPCTVNQPDPPPPQLPIEQIIFQCHNDESPCQSVCDPPLPNLSCRQYSLQNRYSLKKISKIDIDCTPPPDSSYTICYALRYNGTNTNWTSHYLAFGGCGDATSAFTVEFNPTSTAGEVATGEWFMTELCHACTKCLWTITFDDGSSCTIDPSHVPNGGGGYKNCCESGN